MTQEERTDLENRVKKVIDSIRPYLQNDGGEDRLFVIAHSMLSALECLLCCTRQRPVAFMLDMFSGHCIVISFFCVSCIGVSMGS